MKVVKPKYYDAFQCIADKCPFTCCSGWMVEIDKKTFQKYRKAPGAIGKKLNQYVKRNRKEGIEDIRYGRFTLTEEAKCPFFNKDNLCDIYIELGEQSMCVTCKTYPRILYQYGPLFERHLTASCPVVAHTLVSQTDPIEFLLVDENLTDLDYQHIGKKEMNMETQLILSDVRQLCLSIAQNRDLPVGKRVLLMKKLTDNIKQAVEGKSYNEAYLAKLYHIANNKKIIEALDQLPKDTSTKKITLMAIYEYIYNADVRIAFRSILNSIDVVSQQIKAGQINLNHLEEEFNDYIKDKETIFENYIVYYLFYHYIMKTDIEKDLTEVIKFLIVYYTLLRYMIQLTWYHQNKQLTEEDIEKILYVFSRETDHNKLIENNLKKQDIIKALDDLGCCSLLLN